MGLDRLTRPLDLYENLRWMRGANRNIVMALLFSGALHLFCWRYFLWDFVTPSYTNAVFIEIRRTEPDAELRPINPRAIGKRGNRPSRTAITLPLSALTPKWSIDPAAIAPDSTPASDNDIQISSNWTDPRAYTEARLSGFEGVGAEQADFLTSLWRMIDQYIEENPFLSEYNRTGNVFLRFEVDEEGRLENRSIQAKAEDPVLKVIAARAVRKAVKNETGDVRFPRRRSVINARFTWSGYQACGDLRGLRGHYLSFCHYAENKRKRFTAGEKVGTYTSKILKHGPWAYEEIQRYRREESRRNSQFDPFEDYKRDRDWGL